MSGIEHVSTRPNDLIKHPRLSYLFRELVGRNRLDSRFLYITDGGHYENLGLVELLRRGCGKIYCFDASGGKPAAALGDAIALARSELGVEVAINPTDIKLDEEGYAEDSCAVGVIKYDGKVVGRLVYAPTVLTHKVPWDVRAYKEADPVFPHHSTGDQLYTDQRFEAYRALGEQPASGRGRRCARASRTRRIRSIRLVLRTAPSSWRRGSRKNCIIEGVGRGGGGVAPLLLMGLLHIRQAWPLETHGA